MLIAFDHCVRPQFDEGERILIVSSCFDAMNLRIRVCGVSLDVAIPRPMIFVCDNVVELISTVPYVS